MAYELCYTSAPRGLLPGTSGFCTVKTTRGIPLPLRELLESLSHYRHLFPPNHPDAQRNPVNLQSVVATVGGRRWQIVSRLQDCGVDHTQRGNFFAHHLALDAGEARKCCPTKILLQQGLFAAAWDDRVEELPGPPALASESEPMRVCRSWEAVTGDAGWAGAVAQRVENREKIYLVYQPGMQILPLISEVLGLLPEGQQHDVTFSSYFNGASRVAECGLRCVVAGSEEHRAANDSSAFVVELTSALGEPPAGLLVEAARNGKLASKTQFAIPTSVGVPLPSFDPSPEYQLVDAPPVSQLAVGPPKLQSQRGAAANQREARPARRGLSAAIWALPVGAVAGMAVACLALLPIMFIVLGKLGKETANLNASKKDIESLKSDLDREKNAAKTSDERITELAQTKKDLEKKEADLTGLRAELAAIKGLREADKVPKQTPAGTAAPTEEPKPPSTPAPKPRADGTPKQ